MVSRRVPSVDTSVLIRLKLDYLEFRLILYNDQDVLHDRIECSSGQGACIWGGSERQREETTHGTQLVTHNT